MKTFYLIIDESGAKGYSENTEKYLQEFGVMVGFLVPSEYLMVWRSKSEKFFDKFFSNIDFLFILAKDFVFCMEFIVPSFCVALFVDNISFNLE